MVRDSADLANLAIQAIEESKGLRIVALDLSELTVVTDYFVICSGTSSTHIQGIAERVEERFEAAGYRLLHREGGKKGGWVLLDYADIVVHIFDQISREFYNLERLWGDAKPLEVPAEQAAGR
ncbi:MAG TPA: ribosome silencing factor [Bacillota bacterium]|jgi:ribosome-associated protein